MVFIPGMNLLNMALTVIQQQTIQYYQFDGRTVNAIGQWVSSYLPVVDIVGSWQPVPRNLYMQYGLDLQKDYFTFYTSNDVLDITRDVSSDVVEYLGRKYKVESNNDWYQLDGWKGILVCDKGASNV